MIINEGGRNVFIVTDAVLNKLGVPDYLQKNNIGYHVYDGIIPDPTFKVIEEGLRKSVNANCDVVLAIGGGPVIDAAKMIAMCQSNNYKAQQLVGLFKAKKPCMPLCGY